MNCSLQKTAGTSLRAGSKTQAFKAPVLTSRNVAFVPSRPAAQKLAVQCQAGVWSERPCASRLNSYGKGCHNVLWMVNCPKRYPVQPCQAGLHTTAAAAAAVTAAAAAAAVAAAVADPHDIVTIVPAAAAEAEAVEQKAAAPARKPTLHSQAAPETYAIVEISGKQMFVEPGKWYVTNRLKVRGLRGGLLHNVRWTDVSHII